MSSNIKPSPPNAFGGEGWVRGSTSAVAMYKSAHPLPEAIDFPERLPHPSLLP